MLQAVPAVGAWGSAARASLRRPGESSARCRGEQGRSTSGLTNIGSLTWPGLHRGPHVRASFGQPHLPRRLTTTYIRRPEAPFLPQISHAMKTPFRPTAADQRAGCQAACITPSGARSAALANSSLQQWKNPEISVNKPVCVLSQPLDFLPFLSLSRLCKSSAGALQPASGAEISTSSQLCARRSAVCCSQQLAGNQFKMFHFQTPPRNPWISPLTLTEAGAGAFNRFALAFSIGRARDAACVVSSALTLLPQHRSQGRP